MTIPVRRYWRIRHLVINPNINNRVSWSEIQMRSVAGGSDLTGITGNAIEDSHSFSQPASQAFDNNTTTTWACNDSGNKSWVGWDFAAGNEKAITEIVITSRNDASYIQNATTFSLEYSSTADEGSWTELCRWNATWTQNQTQTFTYDDTVATTELRDEQTITYGLVSQPAAYIAAEQIVELSVEASETASGLYKVFDHQNVLYALVRSPADRRKLRAWMFTQDDHDFYVLNLGTTMTLVYDKLSGKWAHWKSPGYNYWRGADGCAWEGFNLCCDTLSGVVWRIDADGRLDNGDTPITSQVTGLITTRFRQMAPCYMAELAVSEGRPPSGITAGETYLQLKTNDGQNWYDHGQVPGGGLTDDVTIRWYGLGLIKAPGHVFELTDTGYARRIDGFKIEARGNGA